MGAHARQLFISLDHEKSAYGSCSPGPCTASVEAAASIRRFATTLPITLALTLLEVARPFLLGPVT